MAGSRRTVFLTGAALVVAGVLLIMPVSGGSGAAFRFIPLAAGMIICAAGGVSKLPGMFLPGMILVGAGVALVIVSGSTERFDDGALVGIFLASIASGLALVPPLVWVGGRDFVSWPFAPAILLGATGVGLIALHRGGGAYLFLEQGWPLAVALSVAHMVIVFGRGGRR